MTNTASGDPRNGRTIIVGAEVTERFRTIAKRHLASNPDHKVRTNLESLVGAFAIAAADSALIVTLPAGSYTVQVNGDGGVALVEVYDLSSAVP